MLVGHNQSSAERLASLGLESTGSVSREDDAVTGIHLSWKPKDVVEFPGDAYVQVANHGWRYGLAGDDLKPARRGFIAVRHAVDVPRVYVESVRLGALSPFNLAAGTLNVVASIGLGGGDSTSSSPIRSFRRRSEELPVPEASPFTVLSPKEQAPRAQALLDPAALELLTWLSRSFDVELNAGWLIAYNVFGDVSTEDEETWEWVLSATSRLGDLLNGWGDQRDFAAAWPWYARERVERPRKLDGSLRFLQRRTD